MNYSRLQCVNFLSGIFSRSSNFDSIAKKLQRSWSTCMLMKTELQIPLLNDLDKSQPLTLSMEIGRHQVLPEFFCSYMYFWVYNIMRSTLFWLFMHNLITIKVNCSVPVCTYFSFNKVSIIISICARSQHVRKQTQYFGSCQQQAFTFCHRG